MRPMFTLSARRFTHAVSCLVWIHQVLKASYTANVQAPEWCTVLMSALGDGESTGTNGMKTYKFKQPVPTPAYLVALVGGRLASRDISKRCRVWAEPSVVDDAAFDFSQTEDFLRRQSLSCPYMWTL